MFTSTSTKPRTEFERAAVQMQFLKTLLAASPSQSVIDGTEALWNKWTEEKYYRLTVDEMKEHAYWSADATEGDGPFGLWSQLMLGLSWQEAKDAALKLGLMD